MTKLTLEQAIAAARAHSESYAINLQQLTQAKLQRDRAWAAFLPTLSARGSFTHADKEVAFGTRVIQRQDYLSGSAQAVLTLLRGPAIPDLVGAYHGAHSAELEARWTRNALDHEVAHAFFSLLAAENLSGASTRALQTAREHLAAVQARRAAGEALGVDETRAQAEVVAARGAQIRARNTLASSHDVLAFLTGLEPPLRVLRPDNTPLRQAAASTRPAQAQQRLDLQAADARVAVAELAIASAWLSYVPTLSLAAVYNASQNTGFSGDPYSWQLMLNLEWLLFDGGLRRVSRLDRAARLEVARLQASQLDRLSQRELRQARRDVETAHATHATAQERLTLATQIQQMVMTRYRAGLATSLELVEADDALQQAEIALVAEEFGLELKQLALLRVLGLDPLARPLESDHD